MEEVREFVEEEEDVSEGNMPRKGEIGVGGICGLDVSVQSTIVASLWKDGDLDGLPVVSADVVVALPALFDRFGEFAPADGAFVRR